MIMDIDFLTDEVKKLAVQTGVFIREQRSVFCADRVETKRSHDYVSYVDKEAEKRIVEGLSALLPEAGFIAEEGSASCSQSHEYVWVVVSGTGSYEKIGNTDIDFSDYATKQYVTNALAGYYTKTDVDTALNLKADKSSLTNVVYFEADAA
jgi:3'-phosphoadenosine 5'-phosphosulfate (PAPS) 3'-phosphatase